MIQVVHSSDWQAMLEATTGVTQRRVMKKVSVLGKEKDLACGVVFRASDARPSTSDY